jgi:hypothetical protein
MTGVVVSCCNRSSPCSCDPFRFSIDYSILEAGSLKGGSGISLLHDRDNVQFRLEYVL